ncbi:hypothetical protein [Pseudodesulfovibrio sp. zrk46]|uniref:hypothetical protein n=1 Tax=Pseudodesulfovibrio sp. zrk46 TaxID=2725288 RepID=UPI00144999FE|nr:hypothetical protein [Pseudodesulfovibrio sp. zrk46]QJB56299.1 hypothetical protein HFN16_07680 [Pseudodesulfovibrio sp. zrk46]
MKQKTRFLGVAALRLPTKNLIQAGSFRFCVLQLRFSAKSNETLPPAWSASKSYKQGLVQVCVCENEVVDRLLYSSSLTNKDQIQH